jgi:ribonuclease Z
MIRPATAATAHAIVDEVRCLLVWHRATEPLWISRRTSSVRGSADRRRLTYIPPVDSATASAPSLSAVLLGTGNPLPDPHRAGAATLIKAGPKRLLVDAGRGVCMRLAAAGAVPIMLEGVLLTHLHSDHICDLNDVITTHWIMSEQPTPLKVLGPAGTNGVVEGALAMLAPDVSYRLAHHGDLTWSPDVAVNEVAPGTVYDDGALSVVAAATDHRPVEPTLAFRFEYEGRSVVVAGDSLPCPGLDELCTGADVYIQTVIREDLVRLVPAARFVDIVDYHSTVEQAAQTAARAGVGTLVLTHQVPAPGPDAAEEWLALARPHFGGTLVFGQDLLEV